MLIGKKQTFAVEYELDNNHGGEWMYGKICYWINNIKIGSYDTGTSLRDVLFQSAHLVHDCGKREEIFLCGLPPEYVFYVLDELIYGNPSEKDLISLECPARFDIKIPVDVFDGWKIYLIDCINVSQIIFRSDFGVDVTCCNVSRGEFDIVITEFLDSLELMHKSITNFYI